MPAIMSAVPLATGIAENRPRHIDTSARRGYTSASHVNVRPLIIAELAGIAASSSPPAAMRLRLPSPLVRRHATIRGLHELHSFTFDARRRAAMLRGDLRPQPRRKQASVMLLADAAMMQTAASLPPERASASYTAELLPFTVDSGYFAIQRLGMAER